MSKVIAKGQEEGSVYRNEIHATEDGFTSFFFDPYQDEDENGNETHRITPVPNTDSYLYVLLELDGGADPYSVAGEITRNPFGFDATFRGFEETLSERFKTIEDAVIWIVNVSNNRGYSLDLDYMKRV